MAQLADGSADWFWALAQERGAPVMVQVPGNVPALVPVLERYPGLRLIIDHAGVPNGEAPVDVPEAVRPVLDLACFAQVAVKASALPGATGQAYPFPAAQRSVRMLVEAFGAQRVFWGSDLSRLVGSYREAVRYLAEPGGLQGPELVSVLGQGLLRYLGWAG
jgi:predicted TIM-barrel fold metal-dependent hydrolase